MWLCCRLIKNELPHKGGYKRLNGAMIIAPFSLLFFRMALAPCETVMQYMCNGKVFVLLLENYDTIEGE